MRFAAAIAALLAVGLSAPAAAQTYAHEVVVEEWVETSSSRFVSPALAEAESHAVASYGPFRVLADGRAALVGVTDFHSPR